MGPAHAMKVIIMDKKNYQLGIAALQGGPKKRGIIVDMAITPLKTITKGKFGVLEN